MSEGAQRRRGGRQQWRWGCDGDSGWGGKGTRTGRAREVATRGDLSQVGAVGTRAHMLSHLEGATADVTGD